MVTWKQIGENAADTVRVGGGAVKGTAAGFKDMAVGTGAVAGGAVGGIAGFANWVAKAVVNTFLKIINKGFTLIRKFPRISAFLVTIAAATGITSWWEKHKVEKSQEREAMNLQASIAANKAARVETSAEMGQSASFPLRDDWGQRVKGGAPGLPPTP